MPANKDQLGVQKILSVCPMEHLNRYIYVNHHDLTAKYLYYLPKVLVEARFIRLSFHSSNSGFCESFFEIF